jgi:hypothetical protein
VCIKGGDVQKELDELGKSKNIEVINFNFGAKYQIEDKKIVIIRKLI